MLLPKAQKVAMLKFTSGGLASAAVLLSVGCAGAQVASPRLQSPSWSADSVLTWFELEAANAPRNTGDVGMARVLYILRNPDAVPAAKQDSVAEGLERMALRANAPEDAKLAAVSYLAMAGAASVEKPLRTTAARLGRIYRASRDPGVRASVLMLSWTISDRVGIVPLLREVATTAVDTSHPMGLDDDSDPAVVAVGALSKMGETGQAVLSELLRNGSVRSPRAQAQIRRALEHQPAAH
jgi:hypothetical protein